MSPDPRAMAHCVSVCRCQNRWAKESESIVSGPAQAAAGWSGRAATFKVKLILNFRTNERKMVCHEKLWR